MIASECSRRHAVHNCIMLPNGLEYLGFLIKRRLCLLSKSPNSVVIALQHRALQFLLSSDVSGCGVRELAP